MEMILITAFLSMGPVLLTILVAWVMPGRRFRPLPPNGNDSDGGDPGLPLFPHDPGTPFSMLLVDRQPEAEKISS